MKVSQREVKRIEQVLVENNPKIMDLHPINLSGTIDKEERDGTDQRYKSE